MLCRESALIPIPRQSWASLLSQDTLEGIPANERKRQEAIFELINTEAAYVRDLQLIVEVSFIFFSLLKKERLLRYGYLSPYRLGLLLKYVVADERKGDNSRLREYRGPVTHQHRSSDSLSL